MPTGTTRDGFIQQDLASNVNRWGSPILNETLQLIDDALDGQLSLDGNIASIVLTNDLYVTNQARYRILRVGNIQFQNCVITVPNIQKYWWVWNNTSGGAFTVTIRTAVGASVLCPRNGKTLVVCDGTDCFQFAPGSLSDLSAPTMDVSFGGFRIVSLGDGVNTTHAATVGQVTAAMGAPNPNFQYLLQLAVS